MLRARCEQSSKSRWSAPGSERIGYTNQMSARSLQHTGASEGFGECFERIEKMNSCSHANNARLQPCFIETFGVAQLPNCESVDKIKENTSTELNKEIRQHK